MNSILKPLNDLKSFNNIKNSINDKISPILVKGVLDSQKAHLIAGMALEVKKPICIITYSELKAKEILDDIKFFFKNDYNILFYPSKDIIFYNADVKSIDIIKQRFEVIKSILSNEKNIIVLSIESLFDRLTPLNNFKNSILEISVGDILPLDNLIEKLVFLGYERRNLVENSGQFSIRGGILDIFPITNDNAIRIEFWDNEVDSIRILDSRSQRSIENIDKISIFPTRELIYNEEKLENAVNLIEEEYVNTVKDYNSRGLYEEANRLEEYILNIINKLKKNKSFNGVDSYAQYFYKEEVTLLDYLSSETLIYLDEPSKIRKKADDEFEEFIKSVMNRILKGYMLPSSIKMVFNFDVILSKLKKFTQILFSTLGQSTKDFNPNFTTEFEVHSTNTFKNRIDLLIEDLNFWKKQKIRVVILSGTKVKGLRLVQELLNSNISCRYVETLEDEVLTVETVLITHGSLANGFVYEDISLAIISDKEFFGQDKKKSKKSNKKKGVKIQNFSDLNLGDYVVHDNHGVGIYKGIETIVTDGISKDYLKLGYADGGNIYVSINQMDLIQKYVSGESVKPKISKLGSTDWEKAKNKAKNELKVIAFDLVQLYAKRQNSKGFKYSKDTVWQREFEDMFPFEETDDQLNAIEDVKKDMECGKIMDRLICGDVGYGKTEVAIRAAFKSVQDNKQVAYLVPTTILAQQHYSTFMQRMKDFPINIELLSRFRTPKQQRETLKKLKEGNVDILIGTHRILSKDVEFKDLGLLIVDEEQRFGVGHKEKLKNLKKDVDVLTLTATPIPRTLHMSLTGIRDMSILEEPPLERQPIQTYVMEYNEEFIKDAIHRELSRNGQVYYLNNRVKNISSTASMLQKLVPEANIAYVHGQMSENEIETIMLDFINKDIDVLVCTTIIETGLDIPNANTIIIHDADTMGLSQLYQLRGRVGRSSRIAYAYLMYRRNKILDEVAEKRLQTIKDFTEFGSGFKIAMRDLEIRGTGNILGGEQHGHMDIVGYDMYCKLLDEAIKEIKGEEIVENIETSVDINISAYIPSRYISNGEQKLEIYKKIANIKTRDDFFDVQDEIIDRFGNIPDVTQNLLDIALLKSIANKLGITSISQKKNNIIISFSENSKVDLEKITKLVLENSDKLLFTAGISPYMTYKNKDKLDIEQIRDLLEMIENL